MSSQITSYFRSVGLVRLWILASFVVVLTIMIAPLPGQAQVQRDRCKHCGRFADTSPTRLEAEIIRNEHSRTIKICSLFCLCEVAEGLGEFEYRRIQVIDYTTLSDEFPRWLQSKHATYLFKATGEEQSAHEPYIYAFSNEDKAKEYQKRLGGEIADWETVFEACTQLAAEYQPGDAYKYQRLKKRTRN